ncbi:unnamed protein product [Vitrella brassicaformis CCMP3155]|uniref:GST N-terminal domain-containing protein n=1 Tax=Vitrella brassicaformis (strain CCMP3155) TaxID=1169540 RepID=A0A0G4GYY4_VITBC|nr:unnamed protein product [Vitrella brassicaformis CCMP3155]|eukprot:CEM36150.1 unnamed protein product [Vitrella brassicaformis CCMP3155]
MQSHGPVFKTDGATLPPTVEALKQSVLKTATGQRLSAELAEREKGAGPPHTDCKIRLFGKREEDVRVVLYRDSAAWCPYCQKLWMLLEEKRIPYRIEKINMRSYGDKPEWFLRANPNGLLPVIELDGQLIFESLRIMALLEETFQPPDHPATLPPQGSPAMDRANDLLALERELFGKWCSFVFRPDPLGMARRSFESCLDKVDGELGKTEGPWFLEGEVPSIVDLQYVSHVERMCASTLYWKGLQIRGSGRWSNIDRWFDAFDKRPSYQASKSDYYTHVMDIPPQYGPAFSDKAGEKYRALIDGKEASWRLPLAPLLPTDPEPTTADTNPGDEGARHQACFKLVNNLPAVARFALRGAGLPGAKRFAAPLADPYAQPNLNYEADMDIALRFVVHALLSGVDDQADKAMREALVGASGSGRADLAKCVAYVRDRVGVPRDMPYPAAMQLRAHLNWVHDALLEEKK